MLTLPEYQPLVSIIPGGVPQFLDFGINLAEIGRFRLFFREVRKSQYDPASQIIPFDLFCLEMDEETQETLDRWTRKPGPYDYEIAGVKALAAYQDRWVPVPFLRLKHEKWASDGEPKFERGPSNWARVMIEAEKDASSPFTHRLVLAFDTTVEDRPAEREPYYALSPEDVSENAQFALAHLERDNSWFLNEYWIDTWLKGIFEEHQRVLRKGRPLREDEPSWAMEYLANYITFLQVLAGGIGTFSQPAKKIFPTIRLIDPSHSVPIEVDLVLDLGNSRTCGILVETRAQAATNLNDSYVLQIRDLGHPTNVYTEPFDTRVEFSLPDFGDIYLSRRSGRTSTEAFVWPSVVRVGPEASRLCLQSLGAEGNTGMSSPKRYLWDHRARVQQWRYNGKGPDGSREPPVTQGVFVEFLNKEGTPLDKFAAGDPVLRSPLFRGQSGDVAFEAFFTRSSIMMFMLSEIIMQALVTINSPAQRGAREHSDIPRRLRRIIITVPTAMPLAEQKIYRRWAGWAVGMVWRSLGWETWLMDNGKPGEQWSQRIDYRLSPGIRNEWDEATCSQLVFLYNELSEKYQGDIQHLARLLGQVRPGGGQEPCIRMASIDIGGGTIDLSISTFRAVGGESSSARIKPRMDFREGFNVAGDDALRAVIEDHLLRDLGTALNRAGVPEPRNLLANLFGRDVANKSQRDRNLRGQVVRQVFQPVGLQLLSAYEETDIKVQSPAFTRKLADFFADPQEMPAREVLDYVEKAAQAAGAREFNLMEVPIRFRATDIDATVRKVLGRVISDLCEVIRLYDCDLLMLTGRPSRWPAVTSTVLAKVPVPPDRVVPMHEFRVGNWYPYADALGHIADPKTTVVVGAILCALAEGHLEGFSFDTSVLQLEPTARFMGEMGKDGQIKKSKVWFTVNLDDPSDQECEKQVLFSSPLAVGYRQIEAERWPGARYYLLDFAHSQARDNAVGRLPYNVTIVHRLGEVTDMEGRRPDLNRARDEGSFKVISVENVNGAPVRTADLEIRLQTLSLDDGDGYWLDTGVFDIH